MEKINVAELLRNCPSGMELDCTMYENVSFGGLSKDESDEYPIIVNIIDDNHDKHNMYLTKEGCWSRHLHAKCVIFPKGKTTWEGFVPPSKFKDGDIVATDSGMWLGIIKNKYNSGYYTVHCAIDYTFNDLFYRYGEYRFSRLATEEEKEKLFQAIKDNGYKWNPETKTLENLIEPEFKVGDRITLKNYDDGNPIYKIIDVKDTYYVTDQGKLPFYYADPWKLVTNKFDINTLVPFESKVLIRDYNYEEWKASFWGYLTNNFYGYNYDTIRGNYKQCIPYEGNEHLLGTTDDCDEYFKTWK